MEINPIRRSIEDLAQRTDAPVNGFADEQDQDANRDGEKGSNGNDSSVR